MKFRRKTFTIVGSFLILGLILGFSSTAGAKMKIDKSKWPQRLVMGGSVLGGPDYVIANGFANVLRKKLGLDIVVQATPGVAGSTRLVSAGRCEIGMSASNIFMDAMKGSGWTKGRKYENIRLLLVGYTKIAHFWMKANADIHDITDLKGKRVNLSKAGSSADIVGHNILDTFNIKPSKITNVVHSDANNLLRDNMLDATLNCGLYPHGAVKELSLTEKIRVIGLTEEQRKKMMGKYEFLGEATIPAGTYRGVDYDVTSVATLGYLITTAEMPDDFAYMVTKTLLENLDMILKVHKGAKTIKPKNINSARGPLHKGAYAYYKEVGLDVPKSAMPID